eukprot:g53951.t1
MAITNSKGRYYQNHENSRPTFTLRTNKQAMDRATKRPVLVWSPAFEKLIDIPKIHEGRFGLWAALARAYGLIPGCEDAQQQHWRRLEIVPARLATVQELQEFHSEDYLKALNSADNLTKSGESQKGMIEEFGLCDDCPLFRGVFLYVRAVAGSTLVAAEKLLQGAPVAMNWAGGRHHAKYAKASGFCYVNDIVLGILYLLANKHRVTDQSVARVLYVDVDVHHGDGVEEAFESSREVFTLSFHHFNCKGGFFPGTGSLKSLGSGPGKFHSLNIPLREGITDESFVNVFRAVFKAVCSRFQPSIIVMQCGCDSLAFDRLGKFNLTTRGLASCVSLALSTQIPLLLLGGGGYLPSAVARAWVVLTALAAEVKLDNNVPEFEKYPLFSPDFELHTQSNPARRDQNSPEYLKALMQKVTLIIARIPQYQALPFTVGANTAKRSRMHKPDVPHEKASKKPRSN